MDEFNLPNQHTRSASHTRACADAGRKRSASRQSEIRTNVADVDDVEGLLRLPGLGLLDQVAARLILAGLQRVLLFLRLGVVVRPQLCHLPSRQLKLPTRETRTGSRLRQEIHHHYLHRSATATFVVQEHTRCPFGKGG